MQGPPVPWIGSPPGPSGISVGPQPASSCQTMELVEGEMQGSGDRLQVNVQLTDGRTGLVLWSETFEGTPAAVFDLQQAIARSLSQVLGGPLSFAERRRLARDPTGSFRIRALLLPSS